MPINTQAHHDAGQEMRAELGIYVRLTYKGETRLIKDWCNRDNHLNTDDMFRRWYQHRIRVLTVDHLFYQDMLNSLHYEDEKQIAALPPDAEY